jgi:hypothetical protein
MNSWAITNLNLKPHAPEILASTDDARAAAGEPAPRVQTRSLAVATAETPKPSTASSPRGARVGRCETPTRHRRLPPRSSPRRRQWRPAATRPRCCRSGRRS